LARSSAKWTASCMACFKIAMRKKILIPLFLFFSIPGFAQKDTVTRTEEENVIFQPVEIEARYLGGYAAWKKFKEDNLRYPKKARKKFAPGTSSTIKATFIVNTDSTLSDIKIVDDPGYGFGKEIKKFLLSSGKWKPAMQNGRIVKAYKSELFLFRRPDQ